MPVSVVATGTLTMPVGGAILVTSYTPAIYVLEVDVTHCPNGQTVQIQFNTSVQPYYFQASGTGLPGAWSFTQADLVVYTGTASPPTRHLFSPPRQTATVENSPGTTWALASSTSGQTYDWTLYRLD